MKRCAGINIPVFSLRSKQGLGTGEFLDLIPLIDWVREAGLKLIQILPINDTSVTETVKDASPYSILSLFSLHPLYLNIQALAPELAREIKPIAEILNLPTLDYQRTTQAKKELLKMLFIIRGKEDLSSKSFEGFFKRNENHLKPYAAFCTLRDRYRTSDFRKWGEYSQYSELIVDEICEGEEVEFFYFVQFHLDQQLKEAVHHAKRQGILLKGDFPMGVHRHSVEAWRFSEYFRMNKSMGAPPDFYNSLGQNWNFPTYQWDEIREERYFWLKSRLKWMEQYFDVIRLDHVLGYFRLWEIPIEEVRGLMGNFFPAKGYTEEELCAVGLEPPFSSPLPKGLETQRKVKAKIRDESEKMRLYTLIENHLFFEREGGYHPRIDIVDTAVFEELDRETQHKVLELFNDYYLERQEKLWEKEGKEKLKFLQENTSLILCAEDIGVIPKCTEKVLKHLKIPNLLVQRSPKSFELTFEDPKHFSEISVCTLSNHDMAPLRAWWEEDEEKSTLYYRTILKLDGTPPKVLTAELAEAIIQAHLDSKSKFAIFLLQDLFAMCDNLKFPDPQKERINDPAKTSQTWNWRSHLYLEELLLAKSFSKQIHEMIDKARR